MTTPSPAAKVTVAWVVALPSMIFNSEVVTVASSKMFNSAGVEVIAVVVAAAKSGIYPP